MTFQIKNEIWRKLFHLLLLIIPLFYYYAGKFAAVILIALIALIIVPLDIYRHQNQKINDLFIRFFGKIMRQKEISEHKLTGASSVAISALITFLVFKPAIAFCSFCILAISDAVAAIIGKTIPSKPFFEKSRAGSTAFYISAVFTVIGCGYFYQVDLSFYLFGFMAAFVTTIVEARSDLIEYDDNITIPISFAMIMTIFDIIWNVRF